MNDTFRSFIMLTNAKVTGKYKYRDKFQILPAPDHFPQAPYSEAHHPCLLEVKYNFTPDPNKKRHETIDIPDWEQRKDHELKIIHEIKTLFFVFSFSKFIDAHDNHGWTIGTEDSNAMESEWRQITYCVREHHHKISDFTESALSKIDEINTQKFYTFGGRYAGTDFSIPDIFEKILDSYYSLGQDDRIALLKSATLFSNAIKIFPISPSISFACFVSSIESLVNHINKDVKIKNCKECNTPRYSVTRKFIDFLQRYTSDSSEFINFYKDSYSKRSKILHAGELFLGEHEPINLDERDWKSHHMTFGIERICRIAITNWLLEK